MRVSLPACLAALALSCGPPAGPITLTRGDTTLHTRDDGSFDLVVGDRALLSGRPAPVELRHTHLTADTLWGLFTFDEGEVRAARPTARAEARLDGDDLLLALTGGATATLRFTRREGEIAIAVTGAIGDAAIGEATSIELHLACRAGDRFLGFG